MRFHSSLDNIRWIKNISSQFLVKLEICFAKKFPAFQFFAEIFFNTFFYNVLIFLIYDMNLIVANFSDYKL